MSPQACALPECRAAAMMWAPTLEPIGNKTADLIIIGSERALIVVVIIVVVVVRDPAVLLEAEVHRRLAARVDDDLAVRRQRPEYTHACFERNGGAVEGPGLDTGRGGFRSLGRHGQQNCHR